LETFAARVDLEILAGEENKMVETCMEEVEGALDLQIVVLISEGLTAADDAVVVWAIL